MSLKMKYFVLKPQGDSSFAVASRAAMRAYADSISGIDGVLASELREWARKEAMAAVEGLE